MNSVRSNIVSLKYQRFATLGSKDIGIINSDKDSIPLRPRKGVSYDFTPRIKEL